jgi:hypothetical protein
MITDSAIAPFDDPLTLKEPESGLGRDELLQESASSASQSRKHPSPPPGIPPPVPPKSPPPVPPKSPRKLLTDSELMTPFHRRAAFERQRQEKHANSPMAATFARDIRDPFQRPVGHRRRARTLSEVPVLQQVIMKNARAAEINANCPSIDDGDQDGDIRSGMVGSGVMFPHQQGGVTMARSGFH